MRIVDADGIEGARTAAGVAVVIDVLRAFTVSAYALAAGAAECRLVTTVEEALELQRRLPGSIVSAEVDGRPVAGVPISNSPTQVSGLELGGRVLIQRSSDGTRGIAAARRAEALFACSLVVAAATAAALARMSPSLITLVAMGTPRGHVEDRACAAYVRGLLCGQRPDPAELAASFRATQRSRQLLRGEVPGFPASDVDLALAVDRFDFAMPVEREGGRLRLLRGAGRSTPG